MENRGKKPDTETIITYTVLILCVAYFLWIFYGLQYMELAQRPFYTAAYLFGFLICDIIGAVVAYVSKKKSGEKYSLSYECYEAQIETLSSFGRWYAKYEAAFDVAFFLELGYFLLLGHRADTPYFLPKYRIHIALGIWMLISTTIAVCGYFALRNVRKNERDMRLELSEGLQNTPTSGDFGDKIHSCSECESRDASSPYMFEVHKPVIWIVFLLRYLIFIMSLDLWL